MSDAALAVQKAAIVALDAHPALAATLTGVFDGVPERQPFPYISVTGGLVSDWSTKTEAGREVRLAITIWDDGAEATLLQILSGHSEDALSALPRDLPGWGVASNIFVRSFIARNPAGPWAGLVEHRVRVLRV